MANCARVEGPMPRYSHPPPDDFSQTSAVVEFRPVKPPTIMAVARSESNAMPKLLIAGPGSARFSQLAPFQDHVLVSQRWSRTTLLAESQTIPALLAEGRTRACGCSSQNP